jgi:DNA-binding NarL/FixJ family response regulator
MTRVLVVDDHPLFRDGLAGLLTTVAETDVVGSAGDGETACRLAAQLLPDVVIIDLNMPGMPGLEAIRRLVRLDPPPAVLVLTMVDDDHSVTSALQVGARGYLLKGAAQEDVVAAIRTVAAGGAVVGAGAAHRLLDDRGRRRVALTNREAEVLALVAAGCSNSEIATQLGVSLKTVQNHVSHVLAKMQVSPPAGTPRRPAATPARSGVPDEPRVLGLRPRRRKGVSALTAASPRPSGVSCRAR